MRDQKTIQYLLFFILLAVFVVVVSSGVKKSERAECMKWQGWDKYPHFTASSSMKEQCSRYNINLK